MVTVKEGKEIKRLAKERALNALHDEPSEYEELIMRLAYADVNDGNLMNQIGKRFRSAKMKTSLSDEEAAMFESLIEIDFVGIDAEIRSDEIEYIAKNGKSKKWTIDEKKEFLERILVPVIAERFAFVDGTLYFKECWGYWSKATSMDADIDARKRQQRQVSTTSLQKLMMMACCMIEGFTVTLASNVMTAMFEAARIILVRHLDASSSYIQFGDCYFNPMTGDLSDGVPPSMPRFMFNRDVYDAFNNGVTPVPEVDDLLMHVCNNDKATVKCLIDRLSMALVTNAARKVALEPKMVVMYGPKGKNGKSTLAKLIERAFGENVGQFHMSKFEGYELCELKGNLLLIDSDASGLHVSSEVATNIKMAITSDTMLVRQIYKEPESVVPMVQFFVCSNSMPKAEDKTRGWDRRIEWYEVGAQLVRDDAWFERIRSKEAAEYLFITLLRNASKLVKRGKEIKESAALAETRARYESYNRNVDAWLSTMAKELDKPMGSVLVRVPCQKSYEDYTAWCEENGEQPLGRTNFGQVVSAETGLVKKQILLYPDTDPDAFVWWQGCGNPEDKINKDTAYLKCWVENANGRQPRRRASSSE